MSDKRQHQATRRKLLKIIATGVTVSVSLKALAISGKNQKEVKEKMKTNVIVNFEVKHDKIVEFIKILKSVKVDLPKVEGCMGVAIFKSSTADNKFTLVEEWKTKESHQTHINNLLKDGTWDMIASHLSKDPESDYLTQL